MKRRNDLQWLRALAIFAVCGFHLQPKKIPHGYLGVDIFFVISGYLMTVILHKNEGTLLTFYLNRIKRIFPTCIFVIAILCVAGYFLLQPKDFDFFKSEVLWSVFFVTNMNNIIHEKKSYEMVSQFTFLRHTWSLGVEIQFYLISPFLIKFILSKSKPLKWTVVTAGLSFFLHIFVPDESMAFNLVFCRIWQFLIGTFVYCYVSVDEPKNEEECTQPLLVSPSEDVEKENFPTNYYYHNLTILSFIGMAVICFFPFPHDDEKIPVLSAILRTLVTLFAGLFIALNSAQPFILQKHLDSFLVCIGDASYVVYLVHWPIIVYFGYFTVLFGDIYQVILIIIFVLLIYHLIEIPMRKQSLQRNISFILFFYAVTILFCCVSNEKNSLFPSAIKQN